MIPKISYCELVMIKVSAADSGNKYYFPDNQNIRNVKTQLIEAYFSEIIPKDLNGNDLQPLADLQKAYMVLVIDGGEYIVVPMARLVQVRTVTAASSGLFATIPMVFNDIRVNWPKSYIVTNAAATSQIKTWMFNVSYDILDQNKI